ncbi:hypothetical protein [Streptomyces sp. NBC_00690]|uniref:hypothetical protein n=1 Tax=Streptomyces sp. NBC_00690 TaxID=2975808 RepID=UPI002E2C97BF|nr:hypothetical protein [Streptomyces sp. NBC_00690]
MGDRITGTAPGSFGSHALMRADRLHPKNSGYQKMAHAFHQGMIDASADQWITENVVVSPPPPGSDLPGDYNVDGDSKAENLVMGPNGSVNADKYTTGTNWTDLGRIASGSNQWTDKQVRIQPSPHNSGGPAGDRQARHPRSPPSDAPPGRAAGDAGPVSAVVVAENTEEGPDPGSGYRPRPLPPSGSGWAAARAGTAIRPHRRPFRLPRSSRGRAGPPSVTRQ